MCLFTVNSSRVGGSCGESERALRSDNDNLCLTARQTAAPSAVRDSRRVSRALGSSVGCVMFMFVVSVLNTAPDSLETGSSRLSVQLPLPSPSPRGHSSRADCRRKVPASSGSARLSAETDSQTVSQPDSRIDGPAQLLATAPQSELQLRAGWGPSLPVGVRTAACAERVGPLLARWPTRSDSTRPPPDYDRYKLLPPPARRSDASRPMRPMLIGRAAASAGRQIN